MKVNGFTEPRIMGVLRQAERDIGGARSVPRARDPHGELL